MSLGQPDPSGPFPHDDGPRNDSARARQMSDEEAILALMKEVEMGGGLRFEDFIGEIEAIARGERPPTDTRPGN